MWQRMLAIDRRWIFLAIGIAVAMPFILHTPMRAGNINERTRGVFDCIDQAKPGDAIIIAVDYGPASMPELQPMAVAIARHALRKNLRVITMTLNPQGTILADQVLARVKKAPEFASKQDGTDFVNLGFKPNYSTVVLQMGEDIASAFPTDARRRPTRSLPIMRGITNFRDIRLTVALESTTGAGVWILFGHGRFQARIAMGVTAVMAADYYPYLSTGQLVGLINGMKGAAEYEALIKHPEDAMMGMASQSVASIVIVMFVILGNIGYFATRRQTRGR
jgi:hypothetical protein